MLGSVGTLELIGLCFKFPGLGIIEETHTLSTPLRKVVVAKKKSMYEKINTSFIKTKEQYSVQ